MTEKLKTENLASKPLKDLSGPARRALEEAAKRRNRLDAKAKPDKREIKGRGGLEPTRYEDWEVKGITSDF